MKKYSLIIALCLVAGSVLAQGIDNQKMDKDLKVAQTVLNSLVNENRSIHWSSDSRDKQTQYIEGYGVILSLPKNHAFAFGFPAEMPPMPPMPDISNAIAKSYEIIEDIQIDIDEEELEAEERAELERERAERKEELSKRQAELEKRVAVAMERAQVKIHQMDSMREEKAAENTDNVIDFLLDYGHLISQLKDSDKILVMEKGQDIRFYRDAGRVEHLKINRLSVEAKVKDLKAFQKGEIDREEAKSRIVVNEKKEVKPLEKDITLFQTILKRLYARDLSDTYYLNGGMPHEQIDGLGIIFYMDMVSSIRAENEGWKIPTQDKENISQEERDELIKSLYPKFEEELKNNIIEYGKNIKSLADNEQLIFKVGITKCKGCKIPETLELQVKGKTLNELNAGKLNENQAAKNIKVLKGDLQ
ncbi:hypothetical protein MATR_12600 [Marivirga tractuosa]|uniref:Uncharacterized protein n=1 Tax=Marivirga tractuosa (strain ATCC 23168 / DSM 4126 / NBRC 15989 / NCIMB 1408 / VKM B-1430 / H-43) TaxID=643867 RepID=E4TVJ7_MARTH|nr:hypothetical protein [Marivirga tractuosa]ADR21110.1 hypothetical protein Ftrac_1115 [Marivirga tractuosa DSM 4126]BDD14435.1 hypothetical protein MATR_12600 [Marivirga tractuosa]